MMKSFFKDMLSGGSKTSMMRFLSLIIVATSLIIIVYQAVGCDTVDWMGCCSLVALGLGGKWAQKREERMGAALPKTDVSG